MEDVFKKNNISEETVKTEYLKSIPKQWIKEIVELNLEKLGNPECAKTSSKISVFFNTEGDAKKFDTKFNSNMFSCVNEVIENHNEKARDYQRVIMIEVDIKETVYIINL